MAITRVKVTLIKSKFVTRPTWIAISFFGERADLLPSRDRTTHLVKCLRVLTIRDK